MSLVKKVGRVILAKRSDLFNNNDCMSGPALYEVADFLRKHGSVVDGKRRLMTLPKDKGIRIQGKVDFLKNVGFAVL